MKSRHKSIVKNPDPENALFVLDYCDPIKRRKAKKDIDPQEQDKLNRTIAFGGLVPERSPIIDMLCRKLGPSPKHWSKGYTYEVPALPSGDNPGVDASK